mmetsp:Transcript_113802/g.328646  ORF Transcript_113802/g.328646 Transcript_113802/m.328646 type:complete len:323 (-) Transcript_113802:87-1055(-)
MPCNWLPAERSNARRAPSLAQGQLHGGGQRRLWDPNAALTGARDGAVDQVGARVDIGPDGARFIRQVAADLDGSRVRGLRPKAADLQHDVRRAPCVQHGGLLREVNCIGAERADGGACRRLEANDLVLPLRRSEEVRLLAALSARHLEEIEQVLLVVHGAPHLGGLHLPERAHGLEVHLVIVVLAVAQVELACDLRVLSVVALPVGAGAALLAETLLVDALRVAGGVARRRDASAASEGKTLRRVCRQRRIAGRLVLAHLGSKLGGVQRASLVARIALVVHGQVVTLGRGHVSGHGGRHRRKGREQQTSKGRHRCCKGGERL